MRLPDYSSSKRSFNALLKSLRVLIWTIGHLQYVECSVLLSVCPCFDGSLAPQTEPGGLPAGLWCEPCPHQVVPALLTPPWLLVTLQNLSHMWSSIVRRSGMPWTKLSGGRNLLLLTVCSQTCQTFLLCVLLYFLPPGKSLRLVNIYASLKTNLAYFEATYFKIFIAQEFWKVIFVTGWLFFSGRWWSSSTSLLETPTAGWWCFPEQEECSQQVGAPSPPRSLQRLWFTLCPCPGIDLMDMASDILQPQGEDTARISWNLRKKITEYQETFSVIERVRPGG